MNLGLKIIALFFSIVLWVIVVNIDDPIVTKSFRNIPVSIINEEVVTNKGKTYSILDGTNTVTVNVSAKRSLFSRFTVSDIVVSADLSQMDVSTWLVPLEVSIDTINGEYESAEASPVNLQLEIEDITKKVFPVSINTIGTQEEGYVIGDLKASPKEIEIGGSQSMVDSIQKVVATVDVSGISSNRTLKAIKLSYLDSDGNSMDTSRLSNNLGEAGISVYVQVLQKKEVKLEFQVSGKPADGYICTEVTYEPKMIEVCGTKQALQDLELITIPASEVDISGESSKKTVTVDIKPYLPDGVELTDSTANNVVVTAKIDRIGTKTIEVPVEAILVNNLNKKLSVEISSDSDLILQIEGSEEALEVLDLRNAVSIDLKEYSSPGTYEVPVYVETGEEVELVTSLTVKVVLTAKAEN